LQYSIYSPRQNDPAINFREAKGGFAFGFYHNKELFFPALDPRIATFELVNAKFNI